MKGRKRVGNVVMKGRMNLYFVVHTSTRKGARLTGPLKKHYYYYYYYYLLTHSITYLLPSLLTTSLLQLSFTR